ncbi:hypothetical protein [Cytobacillus oceanisediminis]|uniref:hypothetical protein n=1 Tax=Cytobacillus oceanisediminis TaxID=665099 RepID=UPI0011A4D15D|nr:hypothetical protein [Cytobacillus oceanisediminis]
MNLLDDLDKIYKNVKNSDLFHTNYYHYMDINIKDCNTNNSFICLKQKKTKFLLIEEVDKIKLYLSDADIIHQISLLDNIIFEVLMESFSQLYKGFGEEFNFTINEQSYKTIGLKFAQEEKHRYFNIGLETKADFVITFEEFIILINLILAKESFSMQMIENPSFDRSKRQLAKYISLSNFYRDKTNEAHKKFLEEIKYNVELNDIFLVYNNDWKQKKIDSKFNNTKVFEKYFIDDKIILGNPRKA